MGKVPFEVFRSRRLPETDAGPPVALDSSEPPDRGIGVGLAKPIEQIPFDG